MKTFQEFMAEEIKGWKHAGADINKARADKAKEQNTVVLHKLNANGTESGMNTARTSYKSKEDAQQYHDTYKKNNPTKKIKHNLYVNGKLEGKLE
jgi:hypothetical protein